MPCAAPSRNNLGVQGACGFKKLLTVAGIDVSAENLCQPHWMLKHGASDTKADFAKAVAVDVPILWPKLDETSGAVVKDAMGGVDGTVSTGTIKGQPPLSGQGGFSMNFPTTGDYAVWNDTVPLSITGAITLEAWVKVTTIPVPAGPSTIYIIQKGSAYQLRMDDFGSGPIYSVFLWDPGSAVHGCSTPAALGPRVGQVVHIVGTWDLSVIRLYINGVEANNVAWAAGSIIDNAGGVGFGPGPVQLDDCAIYNKALSPARILAHYQAATGAMVSE